MSKTKTIAEIRNHKNNTMKILDNYLESILNDDPKKVDLLSYWLHTYTNYLKFEDTFDPKKNIKYERGDIVRVNLGFNVGSEHGGRHYAVVLDNNNNHASPVITIIPLSSSNGQNIHPSSVYLGDDIYQKSIAKIKGLKQAYKAEQHEISELMKTVKTLIESANTDEKQIATAQANVMMLTSKAESLNQKQAELQKVQNEISRMKIGSVALVAQITTISKIRIEDPVTIHGALNGIKLSAENLDSINKKVQELYVYS
ncbi:MAG: type II toxin-antitoxin system PemK/MazF family toxin [Lachnospiraceae bacterium]|nr:type II toxin-antitoxin system PemK/MazF family toxin [Lachnospiraceae bacterium]